jgi:hypothetical protein
MNIDVYDNADTPIFMTAIAEGGYPMVHAILKIDRDHGRFVVIFSPIRRDFHTEKEVKAVRDELLKAVFDTYGYHKLFFEIDGKLYHGTRGILNETGLNLIPVLENSEAI